MAKNVVQDVVPGKRSIRDISVPTRRKVESSTQRELESAPIRTKTMDVKSPIRDSKRDIPRETYDDEGESVDLNEPKKYSDYNFDYDVDSPTKKSRRGIFILIFVFLLALVFGVISMFSSARISIIPKSQVSPVQTSFNAPKDQPAGVFGYQIVSVTKSIEKEVVAGSEVQSDTKASGTIIIYNNTNKVQNFIATTRFENPSGLVYRINKAVTVPKATVVSGKMTPGSAIAQVIADQAGDKYNVGLTDFVLPGLKGTAQYKDIFARSKTSMTGGFSGMRKSVDAATMSQATADMQTSLKNDLAVQIGSELPQNFVLYPSSIAYSFSEVSQAQGTDPGKAVISLSGTASAVIFDRVLLSQKIISSVASSSAITGQTEIQNIADLKFTLTQPTSITKDYVGSITFQLSGDAKIVWLFDQTALKNDITGIKKANLNALLQAKYPSIVQAQAKIFPIWKGSFPSDPAKITISQVESL